MSVLVFVLTLLFGGFAPQGTGSGPIFGATPAVHTDGTGSGPIF